MYPRLASWERQPFLLVDEDFWSSVQFSGDVTTTDRQMFLTGDPGWKIVSTVNGSTELFQALDITFHRGVIGITTSTTTNSFVQWGWCGSSAALATPTTLVSADQIYQWDYWWNMSSVANVNLTLGVRDSITAATNQVVMSIDTSTSANILMVCTNASTTTSTDSGVAATTGWHRWTARMTNPGVKTWEFFQDGVKLGVVTTNIPAAPVTVACALRTRTAAAKTVLIDRCQLWSDGEDLIF